MSRKFFALVLFLGLIIGFAAQAKADDRVFIYRYHPVPVYIYRPAPVLVSYDPNERFSGAYGLQGVVTSSVPYHMNVRIDDRIFAVDLHDGTVIKPRGITLRQGMVVKVAGYWSRTAFVANCIVVLRY